MEPRAPVPSFLQFLTGLLTPIAAIGVALIHGASYESALGYFAIARLPLLTGPGQLSLDSLLFSRRQQASQMGSIPAASLR